MNKSSSSFMEDLTIRNRETTVGKDSANSRNVCQNVQSCIRWRWWPTDVRGGMRVKEGGREQEQMFSLNKRYSSVSNKTEWEEGDVVLSNSQSVNEHLNIRTILSRHPLWEPRHHVFCLLTPKGKNYNSKGFTASLLEIIVREMLSPVTKWKANMILER